MSIDVHQHLWTRCVRRRPAPPHLAAPPGRLDAAPRRRAALRGRPRGPRPTRHHGPGAGPGLALQPARHRVPAARRGLAADRRLPRRRAGAARAVRRLGRHLPQRARSGTAGQGPRPGPGRAADARDGRVRRPAAGGAHRAGPAAVRPPRSGGPAARARRPGGPPLVPYVQQMHAAWHHFHAAGRPRHPRLRVCFALLAGLAPLHSERLMTRGGGGRGRGRPRLLRGDLLLRPARDRRDRPRARRRRRRQRLRRPLRHRP